MVKKTPPQIDELARFRRELDLPVAGSKDDVSTLAKLEIGGEDIFGINRKAAGAPLEDLKLFGEIAKDVNRPLKGAHPRVLLHAEADTLFQAFNKGVSAERATLFVDRKLCGFCDKSLRNLLPTVGLKELDVIAPNDVGDLIKFTLEAPR